MSAELTGSSAPVEEKANYEHARLGRLGNNAPKNAMSGSFYLSKEGVDFMQQKACLSGLDIPKFLKEPFYYKADNYQDDSASHKLATRINQQERPNLKGLLETCTAARDGHLFESGMWVEYLNNDMQWVYGIVSKVTEVPPDNWNYNLHGDPGPEDLTLLYSVGDEVLEEKHLRAPAQGLEVIFGKRPWLWQQFTLLQLERRLRKDKRHEYDYDEIDMDKFASDRFELWLQYEENREFKQVYDSQPEITRDLLKLHILWPFRLCDEIAQDEERWDFSDPEISVYSYTSILGSGLFISVSTMCMQIISVLVLMYSTSYLIDGEENPRFTPPQPGEFLPSTSIAEFCSDENRNPRAEGKILIFIVLCIHALALNPDAFMRFLRNAAGGYTTYSRINAMRRSISTKQEDTLIQELGHRMDMIMNGVYIPLLYLCITFILLQTPNVLDIILNALAVNYIHEIDEMIASTDWWDSGHRWIRAGTIELVLQDNLQAWVLQNQAMLAETFDIDRDVLRKTLGDSKALKHARIARLDDNDFLFMTEKERADQVVAIQAKEVGNREALNEYKKAAPQFSLVDNVLARVGLRRSGLFNRYGAYRCWSRWEKILFLPRVPADEEAKILLEIHKNAAINVELGKDLYARFRGTLIFVLTGQRLFQDIILALQCGRFLQIPSKLFFGIIEIFSFCIELVAPALIFPGMFLIPTCY